MIYLQLCAAGLLGMVLGGTIVAAILWLDRWASGDRLVDSGHLTRPPAGHKRR